MKKVLPDLLFLFAIAGVIILADQATKYLIRTNLEMTEVYRPDLWLSQYVRIVHWQNYGAAFGIFQNLSLVFTVLSFLVSLAIIYYFPQVPRQDWIVRVALSMLLGGAVGNLIDRVLQGYVTDFISVGNFPVFNIADASISTGVVILFIGMWLDERKKSRDEATPDPTESLSAPEE